MKGNRWSTELKFRAHKDEEDQRKHGPSTHLDNRHVPQNALQRSQGRAVLHCVDECNC